MNISNTTLFLHRSNIICEKDYVLVLSLTISVHCNPKVTGNNEMKKEG